MNCREWCFLILTLLLLTFSTIGFAMFAAFFPPTMATLGIRQGFIAPIFSSFTVGNVSCSVASAPLATRFGRRPVQRVGVAMVALGALLFGLVPDLGGSELPMVGLFMLARLLQGGGGGLVTTVTMSTLNDDFPHDKGKVLGLASSAGALAFFVGPPIGGVLFEAGGFRLPFLLAAVLPPLCYGASTFYAPRAAVVAGGGAGGSLAAGSGEGASMAEMWARLREICTLDLCIPAFAQLLITCKWTTFDIGVTMWMQAEFDFSIGRASLAFSCASFACECLFVCLFV
jgi:MFS family permease